MKSPTTFAAAGLALLALASSLESQNAVQNLNPVTRVGHATLKLATGQILRGPSTDKSVGLATSFSNTDTSGFWGQGTLVSSMGGPQIWLDWGRVTTDTGSDIIGAFDFGYGTLADDVSIGGPGAALDLAFYDGTRGWCRDAEGGPSSIPTAVFSLTGLPGVTASGLNTWIITVDLTGGFEFKSAGGAGRPFGFSVSGASGSSSAFLWDTGPLLCYAGGAHGGVDSNGQVDVYDVYDTDVASGVCLGSFFFGGRPFNFSSWYLETRTAAPNPDGSDNASAIQRNGSGINPNQFIVASPMNLGSTFVASDSQSNGGRGVLLAGYDSAPIALTTSIGELLVDPSGLELLESSGVGGPYIFKEGVAKIRFEVPPNLNLVGFVIEAQTLEFGNGLQLHNANSLKLGL